MLELIGDVSGATVLDLGCGAGQYMAELVARGATVAGADGSESLLRHARARVGDETPLWLHDLEEPLVFAPAATPTQIQPPGDEPGDHGLGRSRGGWTTKLHLAAEQGRKPLSLILTAGHRGDSPQFVAVLERLRVRSPGRGR